MMGALVLVGVSNLNEKAVTTVNNSQNNIDVLFTAAANEEVFWKRTTTYLPFPT